MLLCIDVYSSITWLFLKKLIVSALLISVCEYSEGNHSGRLTFLVLDFYCWTTDFLKVKFQVI